MTILPACRRAPRVAGGLLEEAGDGHRGPAGRLGHALRRAAREGDQHGVPAEAFRDLADAAQGCGLARSGIAAQHRQPVPEGARDGGFLRVREAVRPVAFVRGNGVLDLVFGERRQGQVGRRSFAGEACKLFRKEGLHGGRAHGLNAVLEGLGAAGFDSALDRPGSGGAAVGSRYAGEQLGGSGLRRGAGRPCMVPVEAAVEGGLDSGDGAARVVGRDAESAAGAVRRGPGQEAREKVGIVLHGVDAVMAPAASDPDGGTCSHNGCDSPALQPVEKLDLGALDLVGRERVGGGFLAEDRDDLGMFAIERGMQAVTEGGREGGGLRGADPAEVPVLGEVGLERGEGPRHRGFGAGTGGCARPVHSDVSSSSRRPCPGPECSFSGGPGL